MCLFCVYACLCVPLFLRSILGREDGYCVELSEYFEAVKWTIVLSECFSDKELVSFVSVF